MNDLSYKRLARAAIAAAADIMENIDPDDRFPSQVRLVEEAKEVIDAANRHDTDAQDLIREEAPAWLA